MSLKSSYLNLFLHNINCESELKFVNFTIMTIEERKISLINWITNLNEETIINQLETFQNSLDDLPREIQLLLEHSDSTKIDDCIEHTSSKDLLRS